LIVFEESEMAANVITFVAAHEETNVIRSTIEYFLHKRTR
jgi:hypothetical protein